MATIEMGPVTSGFVNLVSKGEITPKRKPLFERKGSFRKLVKCKPIETTPLNSGELDELDALRSLRNALQDFD